jgi:hypothetical protein
MRKYLLPNISLTLFFVIAIILVSSKLNEGTYSVYANSNASPGAKTNSPGDGNSCVQCHSGTLNPGSAAVSISSAGLTNGYTPGQTYTITAGISGTSSSRIGFEVTAERDLNNAKIGTIVITDATRTIATNAGNAITHNSNTGSTTPTVGANAWTFDWTAPTAGTGDVTFYGAFNATNSSNNFNGDEVYVTTFSVSEDISTGLNDIETISKSNFYPNPATSQLTFTNYKDLIEITIYSLTGEMVLATKLTSKNLNVEILDAGIYFVKISDGEDVVTQKLIVQ